MKSFLLFFVLLFTAFIPQAEAVNCKQHSVYCHIKALRPDMDDKRAMNLSNLIYKYAKKYGTDPHVSVAIGMQESRLRNIHAQQYGLQKVTVCDEANFCHDDFREVKIYTDLGMFQFHVGSLDSYNINLKRVIRHDLDYIVEKHIKILRDKIKMCEHLKEAAWSCYHSKTPNKRKIYYQMVKPFLNKRR